MSTMRRWAFRLLWPVAFLASRLAINSMQEEVDRALETAW